MDGKNCLIKSAEGRRIVDSPASLPFSSAAASVRAASVFVPSSSSAAAWLTWETETQFATANSRATLPRMHGVAIELEPEVNWLETQFHDSSDAPTKRHDPPTAIGGFPVRREGGLPGEAPAFNAITGIAKITTSPPWSTFAFSPILRQTAHKTAGQVFDCVPLPCALFCLQLLHASGRD